jgi:hypothetical protein
MGIRIIFRLSLFFISSIPKSFSLRGRGRERLEERRRRRRREPRRAEARGGEQRRD